jgi:hypothetical protein
MQTSHTIPRRRWPFVVAMFISAASSCGWGDESPTSSVAPPSDLAQHLTGEAALSLNERGEFRFPAAVAPAGVPIITAERARELASAWLQNWRSMLQRPMERDRGGPIDWNALQAGRTFFARTPFVPVPDRYHPGHRHHLGPKYLILFHNGPEPVLVVSVAAYATEAWIDEQGRMLTPVQSGDEVSVFALSPSASSGFGLQVNLPEQAVARVGRATGARTARVPELVLRGHPTGFPYDPALSIWRVQLDREIGVRRQAGPSTRVRAREIYVGPNDRVFVPSEEQPGQIEFMARLRQGPVGERLSALMTLATLPPMVFDEVTLDREGG